MNRSICHITTLHPRYDVRIFYKECISLSKSYDVTLLVADGLGDEKVDRITLIDTGSRHKNRLLRFFLTSRRLYSRAQKLNCSLFHFHDSDFLLFAWLLRIKGKTVIYDAHEDLPRQILGKEYISLFFRPFISKISEIIENLFSRHFSSIICATPAITKRFENLNNNVITVSNFPSIHEFESSPDWSERKNAVCYIGGISKVRGINELIQAFNLIPEYVTLEIAGQTEDIDAMKKVTPETDNGRINYMGVVNRKKLVEILYSSKIGMVALHPVPNHVTSYPVKMFEYMAAGLPVIASDFPLWKAIIEENNCGMCVDPYNPVMIAEAVMQLINNPVEAETLGQNGRKMVKIKYNWEMENEKLINLYSRLCK